MNEVARENEIGQSETGTIDRQFRRLVRTNRMLSIAVVGLLGFWLAGATAGDEKDAAAPKVIKAQSFQLVDEAGKVLAELGKNKDGSAGLFLKDKEGRTRASLIHDEKQTALYIFDADGTTRLGAANYAFNVSTFAIHGPEMKGGAALVYKSSCALTIDDNDNKRVVELPAKK